MNPKQIEEFFHLSPLQMRLMQSCERSPSPELFLSQFSCTIVGSLDVSAFKRAWNKLSDRHPALRLTFVSADLKEPVQVVNRNVSTIFEEHDWRQFSPNEQDQKFLEFRLADARMSYQLKVAPLWWITLARLDEQRYQFIWTYHQVLFDRTSIAILWEELLLCYDAIRQGKNPELPHSPVFRNYVEWVKTLDSEQAEQFWRKKLTGLQTATKAMPIDPQTSLSIPSQLIKKVSAAHPGLEATTILLGAWSLLLSRFSQTPQVIFGLKTNVRPEALTDSHRMIGHFDNLLPMVVPTALNVSTREWLKTLQEDRADVSAYESYSHDQIRQWSEFAPDASLFECEVRVTEPDALARMSYDHLDLVVSNVSLDEPGSETPVVEFQIVESQSDLDHPLAFSLKSLLESFAASPDKNINHLLNPQQKINAPAVKLEAEAEEEMGWVRWIKTSLNVSQQFSEQVKKTPGLMAVEDGKYSFTFLELNARAQKLAAQLNQLGVSTTVPVGVCCTSPLFTAVAVLGILKAGGVYVPLAQVPSSDTLRKILMHTSLPIILTQSHLEEKLSEAVSAAYNTPGPALPFPSLITLEINSDPQFTSSLDPEVSDDHPAASIYSLSPDAELSVELVSQYKLAKSLDDPLKWFLPIFNPAWKLWQSDDLSDNQLEIEEPLPEVTIQVRPPAPAPVIEQPLPFPNVVPGNFSTAPDIVDLSELVDELAPLETAQPLENLVVENPVEEVARTLDSELTDSELTDFLILDESATTQASLEITPTMLPAQHWFLAQKYENPHYGNHSWLVEINETLQPELLRKALLRLIEEQEILRMKFIKEDDWKTKLVERLPELPLEIIDLSSKWASSQRKALEDSAARIQSGLHLSYSSMFNVAYFERGAERVDRLLLVLHRMICDDDSRHIFLDRLMAHYEAIANHKTLPNNDKPITMKRQLDRLRSILTAEFITGELQYWKKMRETSFPKFGRPEEEPIDTYATVDKVFINLNPAETQYLMDSVAGNEMNEIILAALTLAVSKWTAQSQVFLEIEANIRQNPLLRLDLSNTIAPATTRYPVKFEIAQTNDPIEQMEDIRQQFRAVPHAGFGYELLKYFADAQTRMLLKKIPRPQIAYQFIELSKQATRWKTAPEATGSEFDPHNHFSPPIVVSGSVSRGMLDFHLSYPRGRFNQSHIGDLANSFIEELRAMISVSTSSARAGL